MSSSRQRPDRDCVRPELPLSPPIHTATDGAIGIALSPARTIATRGLDAKEPPCRAIHGG